MSVMVGMVDQLQGASNYLNYRPNPSQISRTIVCRAQSRKEYLDVSMLLDSNTARLPGDGEGNLEITEATHVVVGIGYGAEAYCILAQELDSDVNQVAREEAEDNISKLATKMENFLSDRQDLTEFKERFDQKEKELITGLKCQFYSDCQPQIVRECDYFEAYNNFINLIEQMKKTDSGMDKAVPISAILCPIRVLMKSTGRLERMFEYREVSASLADRFSRIYVELKQISVKAETFRTATKGVDRLSLRQFGEVIGKYRILLREGLNKAVLKARENVYSNDNLVEMIVNISENHPLFRPSRLKQWIDYKQSELELSAKIRKVKGIIFCASKTQVEKELAECFDSEYGLVLMIPTLDEQSSRILQAMTHYVTIFTEFAVEKEELAHEELPWHVVRDRRKLVLDKIRELANHVKCNENLESRVKFFITFNEAGKEFGCSYSVYEADNILKENLNQLPGPPTDLQIQLSNRSKRRAKTSFICLQWNFEDLGPCLAIFWSNSDQKEALTSLGPDERRPSRARLE